MSFRLKNELPVFFQSLNVYKIARGDQQRWLGRVGGDTHDHASVDFANLTPFRNTDSVSDSAHDQLFRVKKY